MTAVGTVALIAGLLFAAGAVLWYLLITTEGVYLGRRVVIWLYDVYARRYDRIKRFDEDWEGIMLGRPLFDALCGVARPLLLDVATGTARLPLTLLRESDFDGYIVGLDFSRKMLAVAAEKLAEIEGAWRHVELIHQDAQALPFPDETFDAVICLEALEFMPDPNAVIAEIVRVARPGALILLTNRKGLGARLMPGKTQRGQVMADRLRERFGLEDVSVTLWQVDYEQVWAYKPGFLVPALEDAGFHLETILCCPCCREVALIRTGSGDMLCTTCEIRIGLGGDGIIEYNRAVCYQQQGTTFGGGLASRKHGHSEGL